MKLPSCETTEEAEPILKYLKFTFRSTFKAIPGRRFRYDQRSRTMRSDRVYLNQVKDSSSSRLKNVPHVLVGHKLFTYDD